MSTRWTIEDIQRLGLKSDVQECDATKAKLVSPSVSYQAIGRLPSGEMNNTEKKYADRLELLKYAGAVLWWEFEPMNLRLANKCFYRVDFLVLTKSSALEVHEVKGHWTDDALVKIKVAAAKFPFRFIAFQFIKGEWVERNF